MANRNNFVSRFLLNVDLPLIISIIALLAIGFVAIYSATGESSIYGRYTFVQAAAVILGSFFMLILANFNYKNFVDWDKLVYILSLLLLISVLIFGTTIKGTKGWFDFGIAYFQPVEIAKIMYILVLSSFLTKTVKEINKPQFIFFAFLILAGHLVLIMMQPDFSSTLSYFPITIILLFMAGVEIFYLFAIVLFALIAVGIPLMTTFFKLQNAVVEKSSVFVKILFSLQSGLTWIYLIIASLILLFLIWWFCKKLRIRVSILYPAILCLAILFGCIASISVERSLKDYQRKRLIVFLDPKIDQKDSGYNIIQSKIAIGSGGFLGKGFKKGTQTQLGFLPERYTDFIFSVIGEEGGWLFSQLTILFYFIFLWRALIIGQNARDPYGSFVATGIATMFGFYAFINIGMVMGIMPVTGVPLLFLSYGGSSIVSSLCAVGILCSIHIRRHTHYKIS
ncbi:MAG: rod shape-determining protein RodA [Elusimicrobiota bacterium]|jgi:rod shape determining protein RodA|nr:rod shape-determining protein RodA [Elusimicrobiota bacterium]